MTAGSRGGQEASVLDPGAMEDIGEIRESSAAATSSSHSGTSHIASYSSAVQTAKHHLSVCLKLLAMMYRSDEDGPTADRCGEASLPAKTEDQSSVWPSDGNGDSLYLAMVMLNSSLLKAMHVADSFQNHSQNEFSKIVPPLQQDSLVVEPGGWGDGWRPLYEDGKISGLDYRRLQAEVFVLCETSWSLEQQRDSDKARIRQLEDECRQLRASLARPKTAAKERAKPQPLPEPPEIAALKDFGVGIEWLPEGASVISEGDQQRLLTIKKDLSRTIEEVRAELSKRKQRAEDARKVNAEEKEAREDIRKALGIGVGRDGLKVCARLVSDLKRAEEQAKARALELAAQENLDEEVCRDRSPQDVIGDMDGPGTVYDHEYEESNSARSKATLSSRKAGGTGRSGFGQSQRSRGAASTENSCGEGIEPHDLDCGVVGGEARHTGNSRGGLRNQNHKPFVVSSSSRSHHTSAHAHHRSRRMPQALPEERMFAKAALRYAKNPADSQAVGKLMSLLKGGSGGGHSAEKRPSQEPVGAETHQDYFQVRPDGVAGPPVSWSSSTSKGASQPLSSGFSGGRGWATPEWRS